MRAAPAVDVQVTRFGVWRAAVCAVLATVWLVVGAWLVSQVLARDEAPGAGVVAAAAGAVFGASALAAGLLRIAPFRLHWDGRAWTLADAAGAPHDGVAGDIVAAIDAGGWFLLHFVPERPGGAARGRWLPVQRRGLEASWHVLRCAVHAPRPAVPAAAAE